MIPNASREIMFFQSLSYTSTLAGHIPLINNYTVGNESDISMRSYLTRQNAELNFPSQKLKMNAVNTSRWTALSEPVPRVWQLKFWKKVFVTKSKYITCGVLRMLLYTPTLVNIVFSGGIQTNLPWNNSFFFKIIPAYAHSPFFFFFLPRNSSF